MTKTPYHPLLILLAFALPAPAQDAPGPLDQVVPVADETPVASGDATSGNESDNAEGTAPAATAEDLAAEFGRYRRLMNEGILDEADTAAKRVVEIAIRIYGPRSRETASALNNLAIVQHSNGQYDAAIQNFTSSVEIIEAVEDRLNSSLVNPLKGLGAAHLAAGRPDQANRAFGRAAHISRVNDGPHNIGQVEILESIAEAFIRMGDVQSARDILDRIHVLNVRFYEKDPMGLIPSLMNRAAWQHRAGYYNDERTSYRRAIRIIEAAGDKNDPMLIEPLRRLGESFYFVDVNVSTQQQAGLVSTGELYFKRAMRIAERSKNIDWRVLADTKLALADYYTYIDSGNRSRRLYGEVWKLLSAAEDRLDYRAEVFDRPTATRYEPLPTFAGTSAVANRNEVAKYGVIRVDYAVSSRGRVRDLRTEANPPEFTDMQRMVHREIRSRVFRPRVVDGEPVATENMVFEHEFSYLPSDLEALRQAQQPVESDDGADAADAAASDDDATDDPAADDSE